ncbi:MAG TPA: helix-turn-helix domain-containing protein [Candidatus Koribacter sp.]
MASPDRTFGPAVLTSWKEVAAYLGKGVRTVQRWEKYDRLPVRRVVGTSKIVVHRDELDRWLRAQPSSTPIASNHHPDLLRNMQRASELRRKNIDLCVSVAASIRQLVAEFRRLNENADKTFASPVIQSERAPQ